MVVLKLAFAPFSWLYRALTSTRNWLYDKGFFSSTSFDLPIISIGNLTTGGTGKTPHIEYLIALLGSKYKIATLSRGYGRKTKGFRLAEQGDTSETIGDEPLQYLSKHVGIIVSVAERRVEGVKELLHRFPQTQVILLDDAFQHRAIRPGLQILLTEYNNLFCDNYLLPMGTLRESIKGMKRADILIVTKTPSILSPMERRRIESELRPLSHQQIYYSCIRYGEFEPGWMAGVPKVIGKDFYFQRGYTILLFTGIADPNPLYTYLKDSGAKVQLLRFPDHHVFSRIDIEKISKTFEDIRSSNKLLLTTEKDMMRLKDSFSEFVRELKVFYIPIRVAFHEQDGTRFNAQVQEFVEKGNDKRVLVAENRKAAL